MPTRKELVDDLKTKLPSIILDIRQGNEEARTTFANALFPYIKSVVYKYKNTIDEDIDGLCNFIITKLLCNIHEIDLDKPVMSYITRTAINQAIDQHRKYTNNKSNNTIEYQAFRDYDINISLSGLDTTDVENIKDSMSSYLPKEDIDLISMYYLENRSTTEIAELTGNSLNYITKAIKNARENFIRAVIY